MKRLTLILTLLIGTLLTACGEESSPRQDPSAATSPPPMGTEVHGLAVPLELNELAAAADLVVRGHVSSERRVTFPDEPGVEPGHYLSAAFTIDEVLRGDKTDAVNVAHSSHLGNTDSSLAVEPNGEGHAGALEVGEEYVLFLFRGTDVWNGHFLALGPQGIGEVTGDRVEFRDGRTATLTQILAASRS